MVRIVGHRGAAGIAPENTLDGFARAIEVGVDAVEFDVRRTADGTLVLLHDATVDRTTDGTGRIDDLELATVQRLDAGGDTTVPTLQAALTFFQDEAVDLHVDLKTRGVGSSVIDAVQASGLDDRTLLFSSLRDEVEAIATADGWTGYSVSEVTADALSFATATDVDFVLGPTRADRSAVERIRAAGMDAGLSTINDPDELERAIGLRPYSVLTDRPDVAVGLLD